MREAVIDPGLHAVVLSRTPLRYAEGAHLPSDRPAQVRAAPRPHSVVQYALGSLDGIALGFTDATALGQHVLYTAAAEASSDAASDGRVAGSMLGIIPSAGTLRQAPLVDTAGQALREKVEGVARSRTHADRVYVVIDADDPARASELCEVQLAGAWT